MPGGGGIVGGMGAWARGGAVPGAGVAGARDGACGDLTG
jgi:hypothetical protein